MPPTVPSPIASPGTPSRSRSAVGQSNGYPSVAANLRRYDPKAPLSPISGDDAKHDVASANGTSKTKEIKRRRSLSQPSQLWSGTRSVTGTTPNFLASKMILTDYAHPHEPQGHQHTKLQHRDGYLQQNRHTNESPVHDTNHTRQPQHDGHRHGCKAEQPLGHRRTAPLLQKPLGTKDLQQHRPRKTQRVTNSGSHKQRTTTRNTGGITNNHNQKSPTRNNRSTGHNDRNRQPHHHDRSIHPCATDICGLHRATLIPAETTDLFQTLPALTPSDSGTHRTIYPNNPEFPDPVWEVLTLQAKTHLRRAWEILCGAFPIGRRNYWHMYPDDLIPHSACNIPEVAERIRNMRTWGCHPGGPDYDKYRAAVLNAGAHLGTAVGLLKFVEPGKVVRFGGLVGRGDLDTGIRKWGVGVQRKEEFKAGDKEFDWLTAQETLERWERETITVHEGPKGLKVLTGGDAGRKA